MSIDLVKNCRKRGHKIRKAVCPKQYSKTEVKKAKKIAGEFINC